MKNLLVGTLFVVLIVCIMIPIGHIMFPADTVDPLTTIRYELNDLSLNDIFVDHAVSLSDSQLLPNPEFTSNSTGWTLTNATSIIVEGKLLLTATAQGGKIATTYMHNGSTYYTNARVKSGRSSVINTASFGNLISSNHSGSNDYENLSAIGSPNATYGLAVIDNGTSGWTITYVDHFYLFNVSELITRKQYAPYYETTFDTLNNTQIKFQLDQWVDEGINSINIWLTYNSVGLDQLLSKGQMQYWYDHYLSYIS